MHMHNPLAQFEVFPLIPIRVGSLDLSFTNASLWMVITISLISLVMFFGLRKRQLVPSRWQSISEIMVQFTAKTIGECTGSDGMRYFPIIFTLFMFVLTCNLMGMLPYSFTVTSHIIVTFALAICVFVSCTVLALVKHGPAKFLHFFLPEGLPIIMAPLMFFIELFSYLARPVTLSVRLAANMMAGHTMLKIIAGFIIMLGLIGGWVPFALLIVLNGFEIGIGVLQAYIFTVLTCVYLNDALHLH